MLTRFTDSGIRDPLRDDQLGPPGLSDYEGKGKAVGSGLESLGRIALTAGLPVLGGLAGYSLSDGDHLATAAGIGLGGLGSLSVMANSPLQFARPLVEPSVGGSTGKFVGRQIDNLAPREQHMVSRIHDMSPAQGLSYIQLLEHHNKEAPHVIQAMKDAYNIRRTGVTEQLKVSAIGLPTQNGFHDPLDDDTAPHGIYNLRRPGKRIGGALGTLASVALPAVAGGLLEHSIFGSSGAIGAGLGAVSGIPFSAVGHEMGKSVGRSAGALAENFQSDDAHAVEKIKQMNPQDAYVHIKSLERAGNTHPTTLAKMKEAYNYRRDGLALQARAGVGQ